MVAERAAGEKGHGGNCSFGDELFACQGTGCCWWLAAGSCLSLSGSSVAAGHWGSRSQGGDLHSPATTAVESWGGLGAGWHTGGLGRSWVPDSRDLSFVH